LTQLYKKYNFDKLSDQRIFFLHVVIVYIGKTLTWRTSTSALHSQVILSWLGIQSKFKIHVSTLHKSLKIITIDISKVDYIG